MHVTVDVVGEGTHEVEVGEGDTYADLLEPLEYSRHEVSIVVDSQPVPEDQSVEVDHVRVLRLVQGG